MAVEMVSWKISMKECCQTGGSNPHTRRTQITQSTLLAILFCWYEKKKRQKQNWDRAYWVHQVLHYLEVYHHRTCHLLSTSQTCIRTGNQVWLAQHYSKFRIITATFSSVRIVRIFTVINTEIDTYSFSQLFSQPQMCGTVFLLILTQDDQTWCVKLGPGSPETKWS